MCIRDSSDSVSDIGFSYLLSKTDLATPLPPEVQNGRTTFPDRSYVSRKVLIIPRHSFPPDRVPDLHGIITRKIDFITSDRVARAFAIHLFVRAAVIIALVYC